MATLTNYQWYITLCLRPNNGHLLQKKSKQITNSPYDDKSNAI